jgi:hypothetical protein
MVRIHMGQHNNTGFHFVIKLRVQKRRNLSPIITLPL